MCVTGYINYNMNNTYAAIRTKKVCLGRRGKNNEKDMRGLCRHKTNHNVECFYLAQICTCKKHWGADCAEDPLPLCKLTDDEKNH